VGLVLGDLESVTTSPVCARQLFSNRVNIAGKKLMLFPVLLLMLMAAVLVAHRPTYLQVAVPA
jgi:hypothetical protein